MRARLPNRRPNITANFRWPIGGRRIHATAGVDPAIGQVRELLLRGGPVGSEVDHLLDDIAVLVSQLLQHGDAPDEIDRGLGRLPTDAPASLRARSSTC
jgi:ribonucleoside-diphosphate reductase alpha chain